MFDNNLRHRKELLLQPLSTNLSRVQPIHISLAALAFALLSILLAALALYAWALCCFVLNRTLDGLDGEVARRWYKQSDIGGYLDILFDFVLYSFLPLALVLSQPSHAHYLALALLLISFYLNGASWMYLSALLEKREHLKPKTTSVAMPPALIEGSETIAFYALFLLFPGQIVWLFGLMAVLVFFSAAQRVSWALHHLNDSYS